MMCIERLLSRPKNTNRALIRKTGATAIVTMFPRTAVATWGTLMVPNGFL